MPPREGAHARFTTWIRKRLVEEAAGFFDEEGIPPANTLSAAVEFAIQRFGFDPDAFVHELTDSIIGDNYPVPDRALHHNEIVAHEYLMWAMCAGHRPDAKFDLVLLNGSGFAAPNWSARVSFANLNDEAYAEIGRAVRSIARGYVQAYQASRGERITA